MTSEPPSDPAARLQSRLVHRETVVLALLSAIAVMAFFGTRALAAASRQWHLRDGAAWYDRGQRHFNAGRLDEAVDELRRAAGIDPDNHGYRLALARALGASGQEDAAQQALLGLRELMPEDGEVNLQLARLSAREDDAPATLRYYHGALYGVWPDGGHDVQQRVRVELVRFLLAHQDNNRALAELLVLAPNLPDDPAAHVETGSLFLTAGDARSALDQFRYALVRDKDNGPALGGAARAAFALGDYAAAARYLHAQTAPDAADEDLRAVVDEVQSGDPLLPRLPFAERRARLTRALTHAASGLDACIASGGSPSTPRADRQALALEAQALVPSLSVARLHASPETIDSAVNLVYRIEQSLDGCGQPSAFDRALVLIARRHDLDHP